MSDKPAPAPAVKAEPKLTEGKIKVRTTGQFMLMDPLTREEIDPGVDTIVTKSAFVSKRLAIGDLEIAN